MVEGAVLAVLPHIFASFLENQRQRVRQGVTSSGMPDSMCSLSEPTSSAISFTSTWARSSSHSVPGRSAFPVLSNCAKLSRWLEIETAAMRSLAIFLVRSFSAFAAEPVQSETSSSNQPMRGLEMGTPARPSATMRPRLSKAMAFVAVVDWSMPMTRSGVMNPVGPEGVRLLRGAPVSPAAVSYTHLTLPTIYSV